MSDRDVFYLWHLEHLGLINRTADGWSAPLWDEARGADAVTVAIIDSGLDTHHPNLKGALTGPQVDFGPRIGGAVYRQSAQSIGALRQALSTSQGDLKGLVRDVLAEVQTHLTQTGLDPDKLRLLHDAVMAAANPQSAARDFLDALAVAPPDTAPVATGFGDTSAMIVDLGLDADQTAVVSDLVGQMSGGYAQIDMPDPAQHFGAHGTACAGLVGGRPPPDRPHVFFSALPYYGVNPFCKMISYATPYSHEVKPVINALLAAYLSEAAVILMPRGLPDVSKRADLPSSPRRNTRIETRDPEPATVLVEDDQANFSTLESDQRLIEGLLCAIAKRRYLVLAAGNEGHAEALAYPASVAGLAGDAIVVAAVNRDGLRASYSNGAPDPASLLHMVSDDAEVMHKDDQRIDTDSFAGTDYRYNPLDTAAAASRYVPWAPLSLDVRGPYGFAASSHRDVPDHEDGIDIASLYTLFGGTSAAASQAAGLISLLIQAGKLPIAPINGVQSVIEAIQLQELQHASP